LALSFCSKSNIFGFKVEVKNFFSSQFREPVIPTDSGCVGNYKKEVVMTKVADDVVGKVARQQADVFARICNGGLTLPFGI
jgi:hypothetical protein